MWLARNLPEYFFRIKRALLDVQLDSTFGRVSSENATLRTHRRIYIYIYLSAEEVVGGGLPVKMAWRV